MSSETFASAGTTYKITIYAAPSDGKKHPVILLVHGNFGQALPTVIRSTALRRTWRVRDT